MDDSLTYHDITKSLKSLGLKRDTPTIAHVSLKSLGEVKGGVDTVLGALLATIDNLMMPSFTYRTMVTPEFGPENNAITYGSSREKNLSAEIFTSNMPSDTPNNDIAEALRHYPDTSRSHHPILSFTALGLDAALESQTPKEPYAHIAAMMGQNTQVLLMGVDPSQNFSLHSAEQLVNRKQFIRLALTPNGVVECPHFPGCPNGFHKVLYHLENELHKILVGKSIWYCMSLDNMISVASNLMKDDPYTLLCNDLNCSRCNAVRRAIRKKFSSQSPEKH